MLFPNGRRSGKCDNRRGCGLPSVGLWATGQGGGGYEFCAMHYLFAVECYLCECDLRTKHLWWWKSKGKMDELDDQSRLRAGHFAMWHTESEEYEPPSG